MGYDEYIKDMDYEDLKNLIERCKFKMSEIELSGKIPLYLVPCILRLSKSLCKHG